MATELKRGDLAMARSSGRTVQVLRVRVHEGREMVECRSAENRSEDDGLYRPNDLMRAVGPAPVLAPDGDEEGTGREQAATYNTP